jgi:TRAP transporter 4TM/12TM fusion protein
VFLFVIFGAFLEITGATKFIIGFAQRLFGRTPGGPAKVAVISSGLMGSLSGSAVANTVTTGTFTIPMMKSAGFKPETAAGVEAAASSGGALMPPVMGAGAYMMLELVDPPVTYLQVIQAALLPAILYYMALFLFVHFHARRIAATTVAADRSAVAGPLFPFEGVVFATALGSLLALLFVGFTPFRAVSLALVAIVAISAVNSRTRLDARRILDAVALSARDMVPLVAAAACVGIIIGVVTLTGVGTRLPAAIIPLADDSLLLALAAIMMCSLVLGMGLPSAVVYLLLATLIGPALGALGVVPLAAHLFIFYFGMLAMVTPPVALAAYAAASIAGGDIMRSGFEAFRISLVGFTLPFIFVLRPELLMLTHDNTPAPLPHILSALFFASTGVLAFAAGLAGSMFRVMRGPERALFFVASALLLAPGPPMDVLGFRVAVVDASGLLVLIIAIALNRRR